jgi:DNA ligase 1
MKSTQRELKSRQLSFNLMLAKAFDPSRISNWSRIIAEPKMDGVRVMVRVRLHKRLVEYYSRNGRRLYMFAHLDDEVLKFVSRAAEFYDERFFDGAMLDGEMTHISGEFGSISGAIHTKDFTEFDARFAVFHAMPWELLEKGMDDTAMHVRMRMCKRIVERSKLKKVQHHAGVAVAGPEDIEQAYKRFRKDGYEGVIVKLGREVWEGKRSFSWMKMKPKETYDAVVVGVKKGKGKYKGTLGAVIFDYKGKVCSTSGMTDKERDEWWRLFKKGGLVGRMVEVEAAEVTKHGALRHPRFKRFRDDKMRLKGRRVFIKPRQSAPAAKV